MARKSLGVLTLDLVARTGGFVQGMDKAERASEKWRKQVDRDLKTIRGGIDKTLKAGAAAAAVATATTIALTKTGMDAVNSQAALAQSLDTTYDSITALKLAAGDAGLDGLEGSLTRLNRRLGAAEAGSGAAANAVKALNLNLAELSDMDVDERVATIADAIRDSGVSAQRAARFAQDLGFEQREAAAFFMQGGDAIRAYRDEVDQLGLSLSAMEVAQVQEAVNAMGIFGDLTTVVSQRLAVEFSPILQQISSDLTDAAKASGGFKDEISELVDSAVNGLAFVINAVDGIGVVFTTVGKYAAVVFLGITREALLLADNLVNGPIAAANLLIERLNVIPGIDITPVGLTGFGQKIKAELDVINGAISEGMQDIGEGLNAPLAGDRLLEYYEKAKRGAEESAQAHLDFQKTISGGGAGSDEEARRLAAEEAAAEAARKNVERQISAIERAAATWGMAADQVKLYDLQVAGATQSQLNSAAAALESVAAMEAHKKSQADYEGLVKSLRTEEEKRSDTLREQMEILSQYNDITEEQRKQLQARIADSAIDTEVSLNLGTDPEGLKKASEHLDEWYARQLETLARYREERAELNEEWDQREAEIKAEYENRLTEISTESEAQRREQIEQGYTALLDVAAKYYEGMEGEDAAYTRAAIQLGKALLDEKTRDSLKSIIASTHAAAMGAYQSLSSVPIVGPALGAAAAGAIYVAGGAAAAGVMGMAHDGIDSVPQTGTWLLEKGERVTTAETSAKLDATLDRVARGQGGSGGVVVNLIEDSARAGQVDQRDDPSSDQGKIIDVFVSNIQSDGRAAQAIQNKWGLSARGR